MNTEEILEALTKEEKIKLCSGSDFWRLETVERLGLLQIMLADGPHGLRKQAENGDHLGISGSVPSTCFPSGVTLASSWDRDMIRKVSGSIAKEAKAERVSVLLGPAMNIKRSPLCGRNFEYFSEDPFLTGEMASAHVTGVQAEGIGTSIKHFAVNNQEHRRMTTDAIVDERTLREIYLTGFEKAVKTSKPWTVMCAYNKVNGTFASEHQELLTDILRDEWGFDGVVVSDWGAVNDRAAGLRAGLDLEMPSSFGLGAARIEEALETGELDEASLNRAARRMIDLIKKGEHVLTSAEQYDREIHHQLARRAAGESMVLLKNDGDILPVPTGMSLAVIGPFVKKPRFQGGGSSHINPTKVDDLLHELESDPHISKVTYAQGFELEQDESDEALQQEAIQAAKEADYVIVMAGLPDRYESEGFDRTHLDLPGNQTELIAKITQHQPMTVVVLSNGSPVVMPWLSDVPAVVEAYLGGQAMAGAVADLLIGRVNPSGRLAETFPVKLSDNPSYLNFPGEGDQVHYREGLFVGYRYYDRKQLKPLFPFGYGLSYTSFSYRDLTLSHEKLQSGDVLKVTVTLTNTGDRPGKEVVQLYVAKPETALIRAPKELKGFTKVFLEPGEEKTVTFTLDQRAFAYYDEGLKGWHVEGGTYQVLIAENAEEILLAKEVDVADDRPRSGLRVTRNTTVGDLLADPVLKDQAEVLLARINEHHPMNDLEEVEGLDDMAKAMMQYMPLRALANFSQGKLTEDMLQEMIRGLNRISRN